jgi:hypothetical protein
MNQILVPSVKLGFKKMRGRYGRVKLQYFFVFAFLAKVCHEVLQLK